MALSQKERRRLTMEETKKKVVVFTTTKKKPQHTQQPQIASNPLVAQKVVPGTEPQDYANKRDWNAGCLKWRDTVLLMLSKNPIDKLKAEYWQTKFRINEMKNTIAFLESGMLPIEDEIKEAIYEHYSLLNKLMLALEKRIKNENVDYMYAKPAPLPGVPIYQENYGKGKKQKFNKVRIFKMFHPNLTKDEIRKILFGDKAKNKENKGDKNGNQSTVDGKVQTSEIRRSNRKRASCGDCEKHDSERGNKPSSSARYAWNRKDYVRESDSE